MVECPICSRKFAASDHLKEHILAFSKRSSEHLALCCQRCNNKAFISTASKQQHVISSPKHLICALCSEHWDFPSKTQLRRHFKNEHPGHLPSGDLQLTAAGGPIQVTEVLPRTHDAVQDHSRTSATTPREQRQRPRQRQAQSQVSMVPTPTTTPLDRFFASYPSFDYDATLSPATSYQALIRHFRWGHDSDEITKAKAQYGEALREEVKIWFGSENDIEAWHTLCRAVGVREPPNTIKKCTHVLRNTHVNIVDLVEWGRKGGSGEAAQVFATERELIEYSVANRKIYPSSEVQADDGETNVVLRHLLRHFGVRPTRRGYY